jgi:ABC-type bacteriocin/lantibiotic exporter with double-glycine peptidase domain
LVTKNLSTGQKQLVDIENIFTKESNKEIFIFDEADNSLDEKNRQKFQHRCEKLSRKKVVILISHQSKNK